MAAARSSRTLSRARRFSLAARLESLETRTLLSALVTHSTGDSIVFNPVADNSGNLWATENNGFDKISQNADGSLAITNFDATLPDGSSWLADSIAYNSADNTLWISGSGSNGSDILYHFNTSGALLGTFAPDASSSFANNFETIHSLTVASDGSVWFASSGFDGSNNTAEIGRFNPQTSAFSFASNPNGATIDTLHAAPDGSFWFTSSYLPNNADGSISMISSVGQAKLTGSAVQITTYTIADNTNLIGDIAVIPANDGNPGDYSLWYTKTVHQFAQPGGTTFDGIHWAPGSDLYPTAPGQLDSVVVTNGAPALQTISSTTQLAVTSYVIPAGDHSSLVPGNITVDDSGTLWFSETDFKDLSHFFVDPTTAQPITDALDSFDTTTGTFSRIQIGDTQGFGTVIAGSSLDMIALRSTGATFDNGDTEEIDTLDLSSYTPAIAAVSPAIAATANNLFSGQVAVFASSDPGDFTYTIDYGNGTTSSGTIPNAANAAASASTFSFAAEALSNLYTINGTTTYAAAGTYTIAVTITSSTGDITSLIGQAVVTATTPLVAQGVNVVGQKDVALAANVTGQPRVVVAQFSGATASYAATINWGDNTTSTGAIVSLGNNQYAVELPAGATKTYSAVGTFNVSVAVTNGTQTVTATSTATISAVPVVASQNLVLQPLLGPIVLSSVATFTADPLATASWFKATIHWGDGTTSSGLVIRDSSGHFEVIGLHIYLKKGTYSVTTNLVDSVDAETALATATIKIK